jgi:hypothetical protein
MKRFILVFFSLLLFSSVYAQHDPSDMIESEEWDIIGTVKTKYVKDGGTTVSFSDAIKKFDNRPFRLEGYMIPIRVGQKQTRFMLASLPINQCFYCGQNGVPMMVLVEMAEPIPFSKEPIAVKGTLKLSSAANADPVTLKMAKKG